MTGNLLGRLSTFADHYDKTSDFVTVRQKVGDKWAEKNAGIVTDIGAKKHEESGKRGTFQGENRACGMGRSERAAA